MLIQAESIHLSLGMTPAMRTIASRRSEWANVFTPHMVGVSPYANTPINPVVLASPHRVPPPSPPRLFQPTALLSEPSEWDRRFAKLQAIQREQSREAAELAATIRRTRPNHGELFAGARDEAAQALAEGAALAEAQVLAD